MRNGTRKHRRLFQAATNALFAGPLLPRTQKRPGDSEEPGHRSVQERKIMATVGQYCAFLNALRETACSKGRASPTVEVMQACDLGFYGCRKAFAKRQARFALRLFSFGEICPRFVQLLQILANSGRFREKLNTNTRPCYLRFRYSRTRWENAASSSGVMSSRRSRLSMKCASVPSWRARTMALQ